MNKKCPFFYTLIIVLSFFFTATVYAQEEQSDTVADRAKDPELKAVFSIDTSYLFTGPAHNGWGIGCTYEHLFFKYFSLKGGISHMTFFTDEESVYCTSVGVSLFANYYPAGKGLSGFYFGGGCSTDFFNYFGSGNVPDPPKDTVICAGPVIGFKHTFPLGRHWNRTFGLMTDIYNGWQFLIQNSENLYNDAKYSQEGWLFGIKLKLLIGK